MDGQVHQHSSGLSVCVSVCVSHDFQVAFHILMELKSQPFFRKV